MNGKKISQKCINIKIENYGDAQNWTVWELGLSPDTRLNGGLKWPMIECFRFLLELKNIVSPHIRSMQCTLIQSTGKPCWSIDTGAKQTECTVLSCMRSWYIGMVVKFMTVLIGWKLVTCSSAQRKVHIEERNMVIEWNIMGKNLSGRLFFSIFWSTTEICHLISRAEPPWL